MTFSCNWELLGYSIKECSVGYNSGWPEMFVSCMGYLLGIVRNFYSYISNCPNTFVFSTSGRIWKLKYPGIVLYCCSGHCCPMHCDLFKNYCAPPNLGITRTSICRLNFARRPIFSGLSSLTSLKSQTRNPQLKVLPGGLVLRIFTSWKNASSSAGFEPANHGSRGEHVTPRPPIGGR